MMSELEQRLRDLRFAFTGAGSAPTGHSPAPGPQKNVIVQGEHPDTPRKMRPFDPRGALRPTTDYVVVDKAGRYRGLFSTDHEARVVAVTLGSGSFDAFGGRWKWPAVDPESDSGAPHPRAGAVRTLMSLPGRGSSLHPDLNRRVLLPEAVYHVDGRFHYETDRQSRVVRLFVDRVEMAEVGAAPARNNAMTRAVGRLGGWSYDGGHVGAREQGGPSERINLVAMLRTVNRARAGSDVRTNFRRFEEAVAEFAATGHDVALEVTTSFRRSTDRIPHTIRVQLSVDGHVPDPITYSNVSRLGRQLEAIPPTRR